MWANVTMLKIIIRKLVDFKQQIWDSIFLIMEKNIEDFASKCISFDRVWS